MTDTETQLITQHKYNELVEQQKRADAEVDAHLRKQEEDLRLEEEVWYKMLLTNKITLFIFSFYVNFHIYKQKLIVIRKRKRYMDL